MVKRPDDYYAKESAHGLGTALQTSSFLGGLKTAFKACQIDGFWERLEKHKNHLPSFKENLFLKLGDPKLVPLTGITNTDKTAQALSSLLKEDLLALDVLPSGELGILMQQLIKPISERGDDQISANKDLIRTLNSKYNPVSDSYFLKHTIPKYMQLYDAIEKDPLIKHTRQSWDSASPEDKLAVARKIGDIQSSIFGYQKYDVIAADLKDGHHGEARRPLKDSSGQILINREQLAPGITTFAEFTDLIVHENDHAFQNMAKHKMRQIYGEELKWMIMQEKEPGHMTPAEMKSFNTHMLSWADKHLDGGLANTSNQALLYGGDLRSFGVVMHAADKLYRESTFKTGDFITDRIGYENTPEEKHAFEFGGHAQNYFTSPEKKAETLQDMTFILNHAQAEVAATKRGLKDYKIDTPCNTIEPPTPSH